MDDLHLTLLRDDKPWYYCHNKLKNGSTYLFSIKYTTKSVLTFLKISKGIHIIQIEIRKSSSICFAIKHLWEQLQTSCFQHGKWPVHLSKVRTKNPLRRMEGSGACRQSARTLRFGGGFRPRPCMAESSQEERRGKGVFPECNRLAKSKPQALN